MADILLANFKQEYTDVLAAADILYYVDATGPTKKKIKAQRFAVTDGGIVLFTGGGTIDLAGFTLTAEGSGTLADKATAQTWTNKTFTAPTIASWTNAQHDHGSSAKGRGIVPANSIMLYCEHDLDTPVTGAWSTDTKSCTGFYLDGDKMPVSGNATIKLFCWTTDNGPNPPYDDTNNVYARLYNETDGSILTNSVVTTSILAANQGVYHYGISSDCKADFASGLKYYYVQMSGNGGDARVRNVGIQITAS